MGLALLLELLLLVPTTLAGLATGAAGFFCSATALITPKEILLCLLMLVYQHAVHTHQRVHMAQGFRCTTGVILA
ncbi:hypothetical protein SAMN05421644_10846 [Allochromatium warmingii]|uniref:Uncharacterized protein n=1 Tax=Allochromatium warmingii TaxID=61595 RepID=A0A1H3DAE0_ALLWA|nr:hypothetical protein SAMN05421644_10846 [Allochromatium warmingii]